MNQDMLVGDLVHHAEDNSIGVVVGHRRTKFRGKNILIIFFSDNKVEDIPSYYLRRLE